MVLPLVPQSLALSPTRCAFVVAASPPHTYVFPWCAIILGAEDGRSSPRPQGDHHAPRQRSGHGDAAAGRRSDQHDQETGWLISEDIRV